MNCVNLSNVFTLWKASQFTCQQFKGDCIFFCQTDYKLYLHTVIFYAKYLWSSFPKSRSTEMKKKKRALFSITGFVLITIQCLSVREALRHYKEAALWSPRLNCISSINGPPIIKFQCTNTATASSAKEIANPITGPMQIREKSA